MGSLIKTCVRCNKKLGISKTKLNNGQYICNNCRAMILNKYKVYAKELDEWDESTLLAASPEKIKERYEKVYEQWYIKINGQAKFEELRIAKAKAEEFTPTLKEENYIWFDDNHKRFAILKYDRVQGGYIFDYSEIIDYELLEDKIAKSGGGLGKAIVGGAVFGVAGAIAGGTSKSINETCKRLEIKITTKNPEHPTEYITFIDYNTDKDTYKYKNAARSAQNVLSKFKIIMHELYNTQVGENGQTAIEEIKKYKELLDIGAITQEEFDIKKKQLLGL